jgi:uncharacterized membrane protein YqjE
MVRHVVAYGDLLCEETEDALRVWRRRALGLALGAIAGGLALLLGCVAVIAATWDGPHRLSAIIALCASFVVIALLGFWYASADHSPGQPRPFERLRAEWDADRLELIALHPSLAEVEPEDSSARLMRSRAEIFELMQQLTRDRAAEGPLGTFPRSRLMRAATGKGGKWLLSGVALSLALARPRLLWGIVRLATRLQPLALRYLAQRFLS